MFEVVSLRPGQEVKIIKTNLSKEEAARERDEWDKLLEEAYYPEHKPTVKVRPVGHSE
nr:hypothetical protein BdHM001_36350 [Bdellovibrio sp. HM001]